MKFGGADFPVQQLNYEEEQRLSQNLSVLRGTLNEDQRKLLLRIIDDQDLICEKTGKDRFAQGFSAAMRLMQACLT